MGETKNKSITTPLKDIANESMSSLRAYYFKQLLSGEITLDSFDAKSQLIQNDWNELHSYPSYEKIESLFNKYTLLIKEVI